jgi:hypothetical protein
MLFCEKIIKIANGPVTKSKEKLKTKDSMHERHRA